MLTMLVGLLLNLITPAYAEVAPDWSENYILPEGETRGNRFQVSPEELEKLRDSGYTHAMKYPVGKKYRPLG